MFALPITTPPADFRREAAGASASGTNPRKNDEPIVHGTPATLIQSLTAIVRPLSVFRALAAGDPSNSAAWRRASLSHSVINALTCGSYFLMREKLLRTISCEVRGPDIDIMEFAKSMP
jgi:hypothetical protein